MSALLRDDVDASCPPGAANSRSRILRLLDWERLRCTGLSGSQDFPIYRR